MDSLYDIPPGCICMGDGLFGVKCWAPTHARLRQPVTPAFLDALIKRSIDAEAIYEDCGRLRFQRAILAAIELYEEQMSAGRTKP
jgi:hypothetical protein